MNNLKRVLTSLLLSSALAGCAALKDLVTAGPAGHASMKSGPPEAPQERAPMLAGNQVWVPGYYEPVAGAWFWHHGRVVLKREGYRLVPGACADVDGRVACTPPTWRRQAMASGGSSPSTSSLALRR